MGASGNLVGREGRRRSGSVVWSACLAVLPLAAPTPADAWALVCCALHWQEDHNYHSELYQGTWRTDLKPLDVLQPVRARPPHGLPAGGCVTRTQRPAPLLGRLHGALWPGVVPAGGPQLHRGGRPGEVAEVAAACGVQLQVVGQRCSYLRSPPLPPLLMLYHHSLAGRAWCCTRWPMRMAAACAPCSTAPAWWRWRCPTATPGDGAGPGPAPGPWQAGAGAGEQELREALRAQARGHADVSTASAGAPLVHMCLAPWLCRLGVRRAGRPSPASVPLMWATTA